MSHHGHPRVPALPEHERIWLEPVCCGHRTWSQEDPGMCPQCRYPSVEYIRADIVRTQLRALKRNPRKRAKRT